MLHYRCATLTFALFRLVIILTCDLCSFELVHTWYGFLFERSEFLIATCEKKKTDRLCGCVCVCGCTANLGFSVRSANRIRPKDGIPLPD